MDKYDSSEAFTFKDMSTLVALILYWHVPFNVFLQAFTMHMSIPQLCAESYGNCQLKKEKKQKMKKNIWLRKW